VVREDYQILPAGIIFRKLPAAGIRVAAIAKRKKFVQIANPQPTNNFIRISLA
jgi:hypothetical protein